MEKKQPNEIKEDEKGENEESDEFEEEKDKLPGDQMVEAKNDFMKDLTPEQKMHNLQEQLNSVKFTHETKEQLTEIFNAGKGQDHENEQINKFLKELGANQKNWSQKLHN